MSTFELNSTNATFDSKGYMVMSGLINSLSSVTDREIEIMLGEGTFNFGNGIFLSGHDVVIRGAGMDKTILIFTSTIDYKDDALFNFQGTADDEISVEFRDMTVKTNVVASMVSPSTSKLISSSSYLIKCYYVHSFVMRRVHIQIANLACTCIDIRKGSNIDIRQCKFENYNRRTVGGILWLRGDIENVHVIDNTFYKYGNDEAVAIWSTNNFVGVSVGDEFSKRNIHICHNRFYYGDDTSVLYGTSIKTNLWDGVVDRFIAIFTNQDDYTGDSTGDNTDDSTDDSTDNITYESTYESGNEDENEDACRHIVNGIHLDNNEFHINGAISHLVTVAFDKNTSFKDVNLNHNIIDYGTGWHTAGSASSWAELMDFCIYYDTNYCANEKNDSDAYIAYSDETFSIVGNTITCGSNVYNVLESTDASGNTTTYNQDNHIVLDYRGARVLFADNLVRCTRDEATSDEVDFANKGVIMLHSGFKSGEILFKHNHCEGLHALATITAFRYDKYVDNVIKTCRIDAEGNYLQGDTRILLQDVKEAHIIMRDSELHSEYPIFFLEEFADQGSAFFRGNLVCRESRLSGDLSKGYFIYTGSSASNVTSARFICEGNVFHNIAKTNVYPSLPSTVTCVHKNNIFKDTTE